MVEEEEIKPRTLEYTSHVTWGFSQRIQADTHLLKIDDLQLYGQRRRGKNVPELTKNIRGQF